MAGLIRAKAQAVFGLDERSLAVYRIGLGLLLIADLVTRFGDLRAHYTDLGIMPRASLAMGFTPSVHFLSGAPAFQGALFLFATVSAVALTLGYYTRLATCLSWYLLISLHARNPIILHNGDGVLTLLLFWGMFLPLGTQWSLDSAGEQRTPRRVVSAGTVALILQLCFIYWFASALKTDPVWRTEGTAVHYVMKMDPFTTEVGKILLGYPEVMRFLTFGTLWLEAVGPMLLFIPVCTAAIRLAVIATFVLFHIVGLGMCIELGLFPHTCAVAWLALTPGEFWDAPDGRRRVAGWLGRATDRGTRAHAARAPSPETILGNEGPPADVGLSLKMNLLASFFLVYVLLWNIRSLDYRRYHRFLPGRLDWIGYTFKLNQRWAMFAPSPPKEGGWHVIRGELRDGTEVDLWRGGAPLNLEQPELVSAMYRNSRWRKYLLNLNRKEYARYRENFAQWLCRDWNSRHVGARRLAEVEIDYMRKLTRLDDGGAAPEKVLIIKHSCPDTGADWCVGASRPSGRTKTSGQRRPDAARRFLSAS